MARKLAALFFALALALGPLVKPASAVATACTISGTLYDATSTALPNTVVIFNVPQQIVSNTLIANTIKSTISDSAGAIAPISLTCNSIAQVTVGNGSPVTGIIPAVNSDIATVLAGVILFGPTITLTNPTINGTVATTGLTMPAFTAGGTISGATGITSVGTITTGTWSATAIAANKGGTGQTVYAVGDLLSADTTATLSKIADVAAGSYLRSGGVGVLPVWSTATLPNTATATGTILRADGTNWAATTATYPTTTTANQILYSSATNTINEISTAASGVLVTSAGSVPSISTTLPALTLGGTISGGGNQINNVIIGTSTPLAGSFTTLTVSTSITNPLDIGGTANNSTKTIRSTSGIGSSDAIIFQVGNNGATEAGRINTSGAWLIGTTVSTSATGGDIVLKNTGNLRWVNAAGSGTFAFISVNSSNGLDMGTGGSLSTSKLTLNFDGGYFIASTGLPTGGTSPVVVCIDSSGQLRKGASAVTC